MSRLRGLIILIGVALISWGAQRAPQDRALPAPPSPSAPRALAPSFHVDPAWPKPLPNRWLVGAVVGVAVDARDHVWIAHRPGTLQPNETRSIWRAAPPVLEFDAEGNLVSSWGGPGAGYEWPRPRARHLRRRRGQRVARRRRREGRAAPEVHARGQVPAADRPQGAERRQQRHRRTSAAPANMTVDRAANELYVADGYVNHRVIVFDATTGAYKRHWGAYGKRPDDAYFTRAGERLPSPFSGAVQHENAPSQYDPDGPPPPQFRIVHAVRIANDGLVYVCDRTNDRIQVFRKDGTFVKEGVHREATRSAAARCGTSASRPIRRRPISVVPDGTNQQIWMLRRDTLEVVERVRRRRPLGGPVLRRAQPRGRLEGQSLHHRDLRGKARAEVRLRRDEACAASADRLESLRLRATASGLQALKGPTLDVEALCTRGSSRSEARLRTNTDCGRSRRCCRPAMTFSWRRFASATSSSLSAPGLIQISGIFFCSNSASSRCADLRLHVHRRHVDRPGTSSTDA